MSLSYDVPTAPIGFKPVRYLLQNWSFDTIFSARTGMPFTVTMTQLDPTGGGTGYTVRPDLVPGVPIWTTQPYTFHGTQVIPANTFGGRVVNPAAFDFSFLANSTRLQGNEPRNAFTGPGAQELDWTLRRQIKLTERFSLQFRTDIFNLFNSINYAPPTSSSLNLGSYNQNTGAFYSGYHFGYTTQTLAKSFGSGALYSIGGPRSFQVALKLVF